MTVYPNAAASPNYYCTLRVKFLLYFSLFESDISYSFYRFLGS